MDAYQIDSTNSSLKQAKGKRQMFSLKEDEMLVNLVQEYGPDWKKLSHMMENRTTRQCRDRYQNYLAPGIRTEPWSQEEDSLLEKLVQENGFKWSTISRSFNQRTEVNIKNRWASLHGRNSPEAKAQRKFVKQQIKLALAPYERSLKKLDIYHNPQNLQVPPQATSALSQVMDNQTSSLQNMMAPPSTQPSENFYEMPEQNPKKGPVGKSIFLVEPIFPTSFFDDLLQDTDPSSIAAFEILMADIFL